MESEKKKLIYLDLEEGNIAAYRRRYSKLILIFKLFFTSLILMMGALIIYLVQSESSDQSIHQNPSVQFSSEPKTESEIFEISLQRAAQELENATSLIHSDDDSTLALSSCQKYLQKASAQLREEIGGNEERVRIDEAEKNINSCLEQLAPVESTATADQVRERVFEAAAFLSERGHFIITRRHKLWIWKTIDIILENLVVICLYALQMSFIFFLFWTIFKSP